MSCCITADNTARTFLNRIKEELNCSFISMKYIALSKNKEQVLFKLERNVFSELVSHADHSRYNSNLQ